jgi:hypothetical protein
VLIASVGGAETAFAALALTTLQTVAPDHLRGRVMSVTLLFFDGSLPLGYLLMGWLAGLSGLPRPCSSVPYSACWSREWDGCGAKLWRRMVQRKNPLLMSAGGKQGASCQVERL